MSSTNLCQTHLRCPSLQREPGSCSSNICTLGWLGDKSCSSNSNPPACRTNQNPAGDLTPNRLDFWSPFGYVFRSGCISDRESDSRYRYLGLKSYSPMGKLRPTASPDAETCEVDPREKFTSVWQVGFSFCASRAAKQLGGSLSTQFAQR